MKKIIVSILLLVSVQIYLFSQGYTTISQEIKNSKEYKGKEFRYSAFIKLTPNSEDSGYLYLRVEREDKKTGFFQNLQIISTKSDQWKKCELTGKIDESVKAIYFGCLIQGKSTLWLDELTLEFKDAKGQWQPYKVLNSGFEEIENDMPKEWKTNPKLLAYYDFKCVTESPYKGKYSLNIARKPEEIVNKEYLANGPVIKLPTPDKNSNTSIEKALFLRRSVRQFANDSLTLKEVSQILWAAYGVSDSVSYPGFYLKTAPSAGARYPFEVYLVVGKVKGLEAGVYRFLPITHSIKQVIKGDIRKLLAVVALEQSFIGDAPATLVYTAVFERNTSKYKERGRERYVCMDLGHSGENVYLQGESLNIGTCAIGAFEDKDMITLFKFPKDEEPLYIMPFGKLNKADIDYKVEMFNSLK